MQILKDRAQNGQKGIRFALSFGRLADHRFGRLADRRFGQRHTKNAVSQSIFKILYKSKLP